MTEPKPAYPHIVVSLDGEPHEVFNRVIQALHEHDVPESRTALFGVAAILTGDPAMVARKWVTAKEVDPYGETIAGIRGVITAVLESPEALRQMSERERANLITIEEFVRQTDNA